MRQRGMESIATEHSESTQPFNLPKEKLNEIFSLKEKSEVLPSTKLILEQQQQLQQYQSKLDFQEQQLALQQAQLDRLSDLLTQSTKQFSLEGWNYKKSWAQFCQYVSSLQGSEAYQPRFSMQQILLSYVGSFLGIAALAYISVNTHYPLIAAPFGAAAVLVFAVPSSPLAQPRNLIFGNLIGGLASIIMVSLFGADPWVMALSVATAIKLMQLTKTLHPPGGAVALVGVMSHAKWEFLFTPVLTGSIVLLLCTIAFNNLMPGRSYPQHWL
jgi:HPP family